MLNTILCVFAFLIFPILVELFIVVFGHASLSYDIDELKNDRIRGIFTEREFKWQLFWTYTYHISIFVITTIGMAGLIYAGAW